jgi:penicillin-insensitive murein endopeptidase
VGGDDGCGKEVDNWLKQIAKSLKPAPKPKPTAKAKRWIPPSERRKTTLAELPEECGPVLDSPGTTLAEENLPKPRPAATARN